MPDLGICYFIGGWGWLDILCVLSGTNVRKKQNGVAKLAKFCNFAGINIIGLKCWTLQTHKESI